MISAIAPILVSDSITQIASEQPTPPIVITGSHGGLAAAIFAAQKKVKGVIFNDAGVGKEQAGIAGLWLLEQLGIMAAAVDTFTACIGVGNETENGRISHANRFALDAGVTINQRAKNAAILMAEAICQSKMDIEFEKLNEVEKEIFVDQHGNRIVTLDSNSMITLEHVNAVVLTGSHGGMVGNMPAIKYKVLAVFYNDAGVGKKNAGISRLAWLQAHGIIGVTVDANSAKIGIGLDTYQNGIVSFVNEIGQNAGIKRGMTAKESAFIILENLSGAFNSKKPTFGD